MSKNLVISTAILAATIATAACEKIPSGKTNQSGSVRTEAGEQAKSQQTEPQERSDQTPNQATPAEIRQASKSAQGAPGETEQANKSTQPAPAQTQQANKFTQGALGENEQENKSSQAVPAGNEQENKSAQTEQAGKSTQPAPAQTQQANNAVPGGTEQQSEPGRQQAAEAGEDRNAESNTGGQPSQQDRTNCTRRACLLRVHNYPPRWNAALTLGVVKIKPALRLYERLGFRTTHEDERKFYMRHDWRVLR